MLREIKRNAPIAQLIKDFANKKSGKVTESRVEIKKRFEFLDWKVQKKIMQIFLDSGKGDRDWAYSRLIDYWDKSFEKKIHGLFFAISQKSILLTIMTHSQAKKTTISCV